MLKLNYFFLFLIFFICSESNARTLITFYPESINFKGYNLVLYEDKKDVLEVFEKNKNWKDNPQYKNTKFSNCHNFINVPVGTANGNHSYGAICNIDDDIEEYMVCGDIMLGRLKIEKPQENWEFRDLVLFVINNCYGG